MITHNPEAAAYGDRIIHMRDGAIVQLGTPEEILTQPANDYVRAFVQDVDRTRIITAGAIMKWPEILMHPKDGPALAVKRMREQGVSTLFVTDAARRFRGVVSIDDALTLMRENKHSLEDVLLTDVPTTTAETPIAKLVPVAAGTKIPIPVLAEDRTLLGIVGRATLLASIAGELS